LNSKFVGSFNGAITIYNKQLEQNKQIKEDFRLEHANEFETRTIKKKLKL